MSATQQPRPNPMKGRVVARGETTASAGNVANIITVVRILLAPVFVWMLIADDGQGGLLRWLAAGLFLLAILTDAVDGFLARDRNLVTDQGKLLDPIADKVLVGGALVALSILGELPWWVTIVILVREVGITVWRLIALRDHVIPAGILGKIKTWAQAIAISFALVPLPALLGEWMNVVNLVLMSAAFVLTVVSGVEYLYQAWKADRAKKAA
ncbi:MAG TPA: CDP-diacylglycerol--glycerol-3-phosphate 3-phosphatidyltransferase [Pseudolysinimonas sp.]|jgi:CDP-diacylglycerol--glycerol-3-phosphate 3-phosphatidyltransferase|nr:CDP-diacylglycerol--glycerol-3-phosphate 3-phosphatidyltransferase [Pseudolysinimonas sp.]